MGRESNRVYTSNGAREAPASCVQRKECNEWVTNEVVERGNERNAAQFKWSPIGPAVMSQAGVPTLEEAVVMGRGWAQVGGGMSHMGCVRAFPNAG